MTRFKFDDADLVAPKPVEGETYRETFDRFQLKRGLIIAKHFFDFGQRHPDIKMEDEIIEDILARMDFEQ